MFKQVSYQRVRIIVLLFWRYCKAVKQEKDNKIWNDFVAQKREKHDFSLLCCMS